MSGLEWPAGFERTPENERRRQSQFTVSLGDTTEDLATEIGRLDPDDWRASIGNQHTKANGLPRYNARPDDPGFVLRWTDGEDQYAVACDAYADLRDNVRTVYLWLHETRMRSQRPVTTGESEFAAARLPEGEATAAGPPPHEVLGVAADAPESVVEAAARERIKGAHPDHGGSTAELRRVREARDALLGDR
jgi:hypothetical protein